MSRSNDSIRSIFLDFGGCIDAPGIHTRTLFWRAFSLPTQIERPFFHDAYSEVDKQFMRSGEATNWGLQKFNQETALRIAKILSVPEVDAVKAATIVTSQMEKYILSSKNSLEQISLPMHIISNFTGNLQIILDEFQMTYLFKSVTESFYVKHSKPDLEIFRIAISKQQERAENCLYVGDNPINDIAPVKKLGWKAFLIHEPDTRRECGADAYLTDLRELSSLVHHK